MKLNKSVVTIVLIILFMFLILNFSQATTDNVTNNETANSNEINSQNPTVIAIQITSPNTGTYTEEQTVYICVYFDNKITGTPPTLKIKFGDGDERNITNGTIHNDTVVSTFGQYIEYTYNIQEGDNGYLTTTGLEGGDIKDVNGNKAILSCPEITGSISINAKTKKVQEENDKNDDNNTNEEKDKTNNINKDNDKNNNTNKDTTIISKKILPYTGIGCTVLIICIILSIIGVLAKLKYDKYKRI